MAVRFNLTHQFKKNGNEKAVVFKIDGELNADTSLIFEQEVKNIFLNDPQDIQLDMDDVTIIVSSAIGSLLLLQDFVTSQKHKFQVIALNDKVRNILHLTGIDNILVI